MIKKIVKKLTGNNTGNNDKNSQVQNKENKPYQIENILIEVKNFRQIEEYCCDGYQEYFDKISVKSFENYKMDMIRTVLVNDDPEMLKYLLKKINNFNMFDIAEKFKYCYNNNNKNIKEILKILFDFNLDIKKNILDNSNFRYYLNNKKLDVVKVIHEERLKENIPKMNFDFGVTVSNYNDINVLFWLIDEDFFVLEKINKQTFEKNRIKLFRDYLKTNKANLEDFKTLMNKLEFKNTDLPEIFNKNSCSTGYTHILYDLINKNKKELIYYLFEHIKPADIINKENNGFEYIKKLIYTNDYELFMFLMEQMNKLKLFQNTFYYYESARIIDCIDDNTDYRIIYELLKLNIEPKNTSKYYPIYKMINHSYI